MLALRTSLIICGPFFLVGDDHAGSFCSLTEEQIQRYNAGRKGSIETMPDTPGLAVWKSGHIGVYIGSGEVIEAMDTRYGVVKTKLQGRGWSHWLEVPGIKYE